MATCLWSFEKLAGLCNHKNPAARIWAADRLQMFYPEQSQAVMENLIFDKEDEVARQVADYFVDHPDAGGANALLDAYKKSEGFLAGRLAHALSVRKEKSLINAFLDKYPSGAEKDPLGYSFSLKAIAFLDTPEARRIVQDGLKSIQGFGEYEMSAAGNIFTANLAAGTDIRELFRFCDEDPAKAKYIPPLLTKIAMNCGSWYSERDLTEEIGKKASRKELPYMVEECLDMIEDYDHEDLKKSLARHYKKGHFNDILKEVSEFVRRAIDEKERELGKDSLGRWEISGDAPYPCVKAVAALQGAAEALPKAYLELLARTAVAVLCRFIEFMPLIGVVPDELSTDDALRVLFQDREKASQDDRIVEMLATSADRERIVAACLDLIALIPNSFAMERVIELLVRHMDGEIAETMVKTDPSKEYLWDGIVDGLVKLGSPSVAIAGRFFDSGDKERIPYGLEALRDLPFDESVEMILGHWKMLWTEFKEDLLDAVYLLGDKRFIQPLKGELREGEVEEAETYYTLCVINGIADPLLKEIEGDVERRQKRTERRVDALNRGDAAAILKEPVDIELRCRSCGNTYTYTVHEIAVDPESTEKHVFDEIICKKCGAFDHYEITAEGEFKITSYLTLLVSFDKKTVGNLDELTIRLMPMGTLDGKRTLLSESIARYEEQLSRHPESPLHLLGYANLLRGGKRTEDAVPVYEKTILCDPMAVEAYASLAYIAYSKGDFKRAHSYYKKAAEIINRGHYYKTKADLDQFKTAVLDNYAEVAERLGKTVHPFGIASSSPMRLPGKQAKVGRNDPCPCGSGKKYKKCCLLKESGQTASSAQPVRPVVDLVYKRFNEKLERFSKGIPRGEIVSAMAKYWGIEPKEPLALPERAAEDKGEFHEWFVYDHRLSSGKRIIESFAEKQGNTLTEPEKILGRSLAKSYQGIYEVQEVTEGTGLTIKDIFTGNELFVREVSGSYSAAKWDLLMVRVYETEGMHKLAGNARLLPRQHLDGLMQFLEKKRDDFQKKKPGESWPAFMKERSYVVNHYLDDLAEDPPVIVTEEKHRVILAKAHFEASDFERVFHILEREFDFIVDEKTPPKAARITWLKRGASKDWEVNKNPPEHHVVSSVSLVHSSGELSWATLGNITLSADRLILECVSKERLERGKARLQELLTDLVKHKVDEFEDIYVGMEKARKKGQSQAGSPVAGDQAAILQLMLRKHYEKWPDENIPALGNMTPRKAVQTEEGRRKVDDLLKSFENMEERKGKSGESFVDLSFLRKELGL